MNTVKNHVLKPAYRRAAKMTMDWANLNWARGSFDTAYLEHCRVAIEYLEWQAGDRPVSKYRSFCRAYRLGRTGLT